MRTIVCFLLFLSLYCLSYLKDQAVKHAFCIVEIIYALRARQALRFELLRFYYIIYVSILQYKFTIGIKHAQGRALRAEGSGYELSIKSLYISLI